MFGSDFARFRASELFDPLSDENTLEQFVSAQSHRRFMLTFEKFDLAPGEPWSLSVPEHSASAFFLGLQVSAKRVELDDCNVAPYWHHLHLGSKH